MSASSNSRSVIDLLARTRIGRATDRVTRVLSRSALVQSGSRFLRRQLWAWPVIAAATLGLVGWLVNDAVEGALRHQRADALKTVLDADVTALRVWMADQERTAELVAADERLRPPLLELLPLADGKAGSDRKLLDAPAQTALRAHLDAKLKRYGYTGFFLVSAAGTVVASDQDVAVGKGFNGYRQEFFARVIAGRPAVSKPYRSPLLLTDENGELRAHVPTMFVASAVRDESGRPIAALGLRIRPDGEFTRILRVAQTGETGETYAIDRDGRFISQSRFDEDLKQIGLLADTPDSRSVLTVEARDPGADMAAGYRPTARRPQQPLTHAAAEVTAGRSGVDADGYRDYRGTPVVGAWTWLDEYDFGVVTEIDVAEAFRPVYILRRAIGGLIGLLALSAVGIFVAMLFMARQQKALQKAALEARQLGQYTLLGKIGAGGMGTVYRAQHAMLRRPTAVKLLDVDNLTEAAVARFEREVQLTAALTHPNTVAVYDYGRTPEGVFYYAMEFLEGWNLDELVARTGPLPEARVAYILRQVCGSLAEAHATGLVHRDVKPANVFLTTRGGMRDFVKVLDFGLVKSVGGAADANVTSANAVTGTPLYLAPEAVSRPDEVNARSDVYAIGAVAYFLLTGTPVFLGASVVEICMKHVKEPPEPPSARAGRAIDPALERLVLRCLSKSAAERPADARALLEELDACAGDGGRSAAGAVWWAGPPGDARSPGLSPGAVTPVPPGADMTIAYKSRIE
jgi:hypothetical protein